MSISTLDGIRTLYNTILLDKRKDRFEMILEPLQAAIQLSVLSFCPLGTKISISNNILYIQQPTWTQSLTRSYNHDCKDDLVYLFSVITRFYKFYSYLKNEKDFSNFYLLIIELGKSGFDKLSQTYSNSGHGSLLQSLKMYKSMFHSPNIYQEQNEMSNEISNVMSNGMSNGMSNIKYNPQDDIDNIFIQIRDLYEPSQLIIIYHLLKTMKSHPEDYECYMKSINYAMTPVNNKIQKWIHSHIAY